MAATRWTTRARSTSPAAELFIGYGTLENTVDNAGTFDSVGTITVSDGGTVALSGSVTIAEMTEITNNGGTIGIAGTMDLTGQTLAVGQGTTLGQVELSGTILGGTIQDAGSGMAFQDGTLTGVTYEGTLDLTPRSSILTIDNGLTATGADGTGPGTINLGEFSQIQFTNTATFDHATITLGNSSSLYEDASSGGIVGAADRITDSVRCWRLPEQPDPWAKYMTIDQTGGAGRIAENGVGNGSIVNQERSTSKASNWPRTRLHQ